MSWTDDVLRGVVCAALAVVGLACREPGVAQVDTDPGHVARERTTDRYYMKLTDSPDPVAPGQLVTYSLTMQSSLGPTSVTVRFESYGGELVGVDPALPPPGCVGFRVMLPNAFECDLSYATAFTTDVQVLPYPSNTQIGARMSVGTFGDWESVGEITTIFEPDTDGDGVSDSMDNCVEVSNPDQADFDFDGYGDACDDCPAKADIQVDTDGDGYGDACDLCPDLPDSTQSDADGDGVGDACDLCPTAWDPEQLDFDADGVGAVCDQCQFTEEGAGDLIDGCSCLQILDAKPGDDLGEIANGCVQGTLSVFASREEDSWAEDLDGDGRADVLPDIVPLADLSVAVWPRPGPPSLGDVVATEVEVVNEASMSGTWPPAPTAATGVALSYLLDETRVAEQVYAPPGVTCSILPDGSGVDCDIGTLPFGASVRIGVLTRIGSCGPPENPYGPFSARLEVHSDFQDPDPSDNVLDDEITIGCCDEDVHATCGTSDVGACSFGSLECVDHQLSCAGEVDPSPEVCNGADDDCNGVVDDNVPIGPPCGTSTGECEPGVFVCTGGLYVCEGAIFPMPEACNGLDDDCDGAVDEGIGGGPCGTDVGTCQTGVWVCNGGSLDCKWSIGPAPEVCDGLDNDCNWLIDDGGPEMCPSTEVCVDGGCLSKCEAGYTDCNHDPGDGCEAQLSSDTANCGACGNTCSPSESCVAGECGCQLFALFEVNCTDGRDDDCDGAVDCADLDCAFNAACGGCNPLPEDCTNNVDDDCDLLVDCMDPDCAAAPECGGCSALLATPEDCTNNVDDDCDLLVDCLDPDCAADPGCGSGSCQPTAPMEVSCTDHVDNDCDQLTDCADNDCLLDPACYCDPASLSCDGQCVDPLIDPFNCGACGNGCAFTEICDSGTCVSACQAGYVDCDGDGACETDVSSDPAHCGTCDNTCSTDNGTPACMGGSCVIASCDAGWGDCNGIASDGCEASLLTTTDCGGCGFPCGGPHAISSCTTGFCQIDQCDPGWIDCDGIADNGCEYYGTSCGP